MSAIDRAIEQLARSCMECQEHKNCPALAPLHSWSWPTTPWDRVHVDFLGPFMGKMVMVVMDAHSKWPEAVIMTSTTAARTVAVLREIFARNGLPRQLVSDNGPVLRSLNTFCATMELNTSELLLITRPVMERLRDSYRPLNSPCAQCGITLEQALTSFLLRYRTTLHATTGVAPCMLFTNRMLPTRLDFLKPDVAQRG